MMLLWIRCAKLAKICAWNTEFLIDIRYTETSVFGKKLHLIFLVNIQEHELFHDSSLNYGGCILSISVYYKRDFTISINGLPCPWWWYMYHCL